MNDGGRWDWLTSAFRGEQRKATIILLLSPLLLVTWKYFGSPDFYAKSLAPFGLLWDDPRATGAVYSFLAALVLMGLIPALVVKLVFGESLADYGVQLGDRASTVRTSLLLGPVFLLMGYLASRDPTVVAQYPINPSAGASHARFGIHALTYLAFYVGWEFHFRGFLQFGLRGSMGSANALLVQVMASCLVHLGKPASETYASILGGILWGLVAYRTRSLLSGLLQHFVLGLSLDWFLCYG